MAPGAALMLSTMPASEAIIRAFRVTRDASGHHHPLEDLATGRALVAVERRDGFGPPTDSAQLAACAGVDLPYLGDGEALHGVGEGHAHGDAVQRDDRLAEDPRRRQRDS